MQGPILDTIELKLQSSVRIIIWHFMVLSNSEHHHDSAVLNRAWLSLSYRAVTHRDLFPCSLCLSWVTRILPSKSVLLIDNICKDTQITFVYWVPLSGPYPPHQLSFVIALCFLNITQWSYLIPSVVGWSLSIENVLEPALPFSPKASTNLIDGKL